MTEIKDKKISQCGMGVCKSNVKMILGNNNSSKNSVHIVREVEAAAVVEKTCPLKMGLI